MAERQDYGPPERHQHDAISQVETMQAGVKVARVETQTMLDRYLRGRHIEQRQYDAGMKLYAAWLASGSGQPLTGSYEFRIAGLADMTERQAEMRIRFQSALADVGRHLSPVLVHVCICDLSAKDWCSRQGHHPKGGIMALRLALDALADHYRL